MASIFDFFNDEDEATNEELFGDGPVKTAEPEAEIELDPEAPRRAIAAAAGPAGVNPFIISNERENTKVETYLEDIVGVENAQNLTFDEQQSAINDFLVEKQKENIFAPPSAEDIRMQEEGKKWQEQEMQRGFQEFAAIDEEQAKKEAGKEAFTQQLDGQLNELNQKYQTYLSNEKYKEIQINRDKSLDSINKSRFAIMTNKATAGTNFGMMKLRNLEMMEREILAQSTADMEKLGGKAWEQMDPDTKLVYSRLSQNPQLAPQDRIQYAAGDNKIKQIGQNILLNVPEDRRDKVDEYLFGKKKVENGQVQYDQDNEPIRITKGIAFKNNLGVYEPSVNMDTFDSMVKQLGSQFAPAKAEGGATAEVDAIKEAESLSKRADLLTKTSKQAWTARGLPEEQWTLEEAVKKEITENETATAIKDLTKQAEIQASTGVRFKTSELETLSADKAKTTLDNKLQQLITNPEKEVLKDIGTKGIVPTFKVEDNKLVPEDFGVTPQIRNQEYVIIIDPKLGSQLVRIGKDKYNKFLEDTNKYFYVDGEFTGEAPGITRGIKTRAAALGIIQPEAPTKVETEFNNYLKAARENKKSFEESKKTMEGKKKKIEELPW
jgi:hypothetical protein